MAEDANPKKRVRRSPGGISVSVLLKGQTKPIEFECVARKQEGAFLIFYSQGTGGRTLQRLVATSEIALLEVEEPFVPQFQAQAPQLQSMALSAPQQPLGPVISTNPMIAQKKSLRNIVTPEGFPASELEDGSVVSAGFLPR